MAHLWLILLWPSGKSIFPVSPTWTWWEGGKEDGLARSPEKSRGPIMGGGTVNEAGKVLGYSGYIQRCEGSLFLYVCVS